MPLNSVNVKNVTNVIFNLPLYFILAHLDALNAQLLKHLVNGFLLCFYHHPLGVQHEHIHGQPLGAHPERVAVRDHWSGDLYHLP